jgi:putative nucleotidyltransferase with HDIG domain
MIDQHTAEGEWQQRAVAAMRRIGLDSYEVGGCIRDELLGKPPKDVDFVVCGVSYDELEQVLGLEGRVAPNTVGGRLVGCRLLADWTPAEGIEISLARVERSTSSGRANFEVETDPGITILHDLGRRDFTINAIARNIETGELVDPFNGVADIATRTLRVIGPGSFSEDPSRILRGLVRVAKDRFFPDIMTSECMKLYAPEIAVEPQEQVFMEFERLLAGPYAAEALRIAAATGALEAALPELAPIIGFEQESRYHDLTCDKHTFRVMEEACWSDASMRVRWAALFHDVGKPASAWRGVEGRLHYYRNPEDPESRSHEDIGAEITREAMNRLQQPPNDLRDDVIKLVAEHMFTDDRKLTPLRARRFIQRIGRDLVFDLLLLRRCDRAGKGYGPLSGSDDAHLIAWESLVDQELNQPLLISELAVNGNDALALGFAGVEIGKVLHEMLRLVVDDPDLNSRERLLTIMERKAGSNRF